MSEIQNYVICYKPKKRVKRAEGIIPGCTEVPLLIKREDTDAVLLDTTEIQARKAVEIALDEYIILNFKNIKKSKIILVMSIHKVDTAVIFYIVRILIPPPFQLLPQHSQQSSSPSASQEVLLPQVVSLPSELLPSQISFQTLHPPQ